MKLAHDADDYHTPLFIALLHFQNVINGNESVILCYINLKLFHKVVMFSKY